MTIAHESTATAGETAKTAAAPLAAATEEPAPRVVNSVGATTGQPIVDRVMTREGELEVLLAGLPTEDLSTINALLTGDAARVPTVVAADMNRWLERNKHLAERSNR